MALLTVEHFVALDVAHVAHVANISECEVVVEASLASPITNSLLDLLVSWSSLRATFFFTLSGVFYLLGVVFLFK